MNNLDDSRSQHHAVNISPSADDPSTSASAYPYPLPPSSSQQHPQYHAVPISQPLYYAPPVIYPQAAASPYSSLLLPSLPDDISPYEQFKGLSFTLKLLYFFIFPLLYAMMLFNGNAVCASFVPLLLLPTMILLYLWKRSNNGKDSELEIMGRLYAIGFTTGSFVVLIIESVLTICFAIICFADQIDKYMDEVSRNMNGQGDSTKKGGKDPYDPSNIPDIEKTFGFYVFIFLLSYVSAGCVEEGLKYWGINRVRKYRPTHQSEQGYIFYAMSIALGFSTVENIGYLYNACAVADETWEIALSAVERICISTPLHLMTAYLIAIGVIRRDIRREPLKLWQIMLLPVLFHGSFDFGLMIISAWADAMGDVAALILTIVFTLTVLVSLFGTIYYYKRKYNIPSSGGYNQLNSGSDDGDAETEAVNPASRILFPQYLPPAQYQQYWSSLTPQQQRNLMLAQQQVQSYQAVP